MLGIFLDLETTGLDCFQNRVIEIAYRVLSLESGAQLDSYTSFVYQSETVWQNSNKESLEVNGCCPEIVATAPSESIVASTIEKRFQLLKISRKNSVFICQNPSFDRPFFAQLIPSSLQEAHGWPYHWLDLASMYFALSIKEKKEVEFALKGGLSKNCIAQSLQLAPEQMPHRAMNGVEHLLACYKALVGFTKKNFDCIK